MTKENNFRPLTLGETSKGNESEFDIDDLQMGNSPEEEVSADDVFAELLSKVDSQALEDIESDESTSDEDIKIEEDEGDQDNYAQGYIDGVNKQKEETEEVFLQAKKIISEIKQSISENELSVDQRIEKALKNNLIKIVKSIWANIPDEYVHESINNAVENFKKENEIPRAKIILETNPEVVVLFQKANSDIEVHANPLLKRGEARLVTTTDETKFEAEIDIEENLTAQIKGI